MKLWTDHPYHKDGFLWLLKPAVVFSATLDYTATVTAYQGRYLDTQILQRVYVDTVLSGAIADVYEGMTLGLGTTPGAYDLGRVRVRPGPTGGGAYLNVWCSAGSVDGTLTPQAGAYITVWKHFGPWMKPPYYGSGSGYYDGQIGPGGTTYQSFPIANIHADRNAYFVDDATQTLRVTLNGAESFAAAPDAVLGGYSDVTGGVYDVSASTEDGAYVAANAFDGNAATAWRSTETYGASLYFRVDADIRKLVLTCDTDETAPGQFWLYRRDVHGQWVTVLRARGQDDWADGETRTFHADHQYPGEWTDRYWLYVVGISAEGLPSNFVHIAEITVHAEDRSSGCYQWGGDISQATIVSGGLTDEEVVVDFPIGFYYVRLEVTDTHGNIGFAHLPVLAAAKTAGYTELDYDGCSFDASHVAFGSPTYGADKAFDDDVGTRWASTFTHVPHTAWLEVSFPSPRTIYQYTLVAYASTPYPPTTWLFEVWDAASGAYVTVDSQSGVTAWSSGETRQYALANPVSTSKVRLTCMASTDDLYGIAELNLLTVSDSGADADYVPLSAVQIVEHRMGFDGQRMTFQVDEQIPLADYPDGTLALYFEREVIAGAVGSLELEWLIDHLGNYLVTADGDYLVAGSSAANPLKFWGFLESEPTRIEGAPTHTRKQTQLRVLDVGGWLQRLPGFPLTIWRSAPGVLPAYAQHMPYATLDRVIYLLAKWFSTAAEIATFEWTGQGTVYDLPRMDVQGGTLFEMLDGRAQAIGHRFTCNTHGELRVLRDWQLSRSEDGPLQLSLGPDDIAAFEYTRTRPPRFHWHRHKAIMVSPLAYDDVELNLLPYFAIAPGEVPGQGPQASEQGEQLITSVFELAERAGQRAALDNAENSRFRLRLAHGADSGLDPARVAWVEVTITADVAAQRGVTWTRALFMPYAVTVEHPASQTRRVWVELEQRVVGQDAEVFQEPV